MADKPTYATLAGGAVYSATKLNLIFDALATAIEGCLGRGGVGESPNSMSGNLDMNSKNIINLGTPAGANHAATKAYVDAAVLAVDESTITAVQVLTLLLGVDGAGSGLDADLLDGNTGATTATPSTVVVRDGSANVTANEFFGDLTGDVTGNVTGNVTGDVVGDVTGTLTGPITEDLAAGTLKCRVIEIGTWDMNSAPEKAVSIPSALGPKIRSMDVIIRNDANTTFYPLTSSQEPAAAAGLSCVPQGGIQYNIGNSIGLERLNGGIFDSASYQTTAGSYNRGWITVWYIE